MVGRSRSRHVAFVTLMTILGLVVALALFIVSVNLVVLHDSGPYIVGTPQEAPTAPVAIVLGAGVESNGDPSPILRDRLDTALLLYLQHKAEKLLLSADNRPRDNEIAAMQDYLIAKGVSRSDLLIDPQGLTTEDSMLRAKNVFHVARALVPTQRFHLPRAVYLARSDGIVAFGVPADIQHYSTMMASVREWAARVKAFLSVHF
jgi:SanA protein